MATFSPKAITPFALSGYPPCARQLGFPVLFTGVLHCHYDQIRQLLKKRFSSNLVLSGIDVHRECWYLYVKHIHQVNELITRLDNLAYFGGRLCVRYVTEDGRLLDVHQLNQHVELEFGSRLRPRITPADGQTEFSAAEMSEFKRIFKFLDEMVVRIPSGVDYKQALWAYRQENGDELPRIVRTALRELPQVIAAFAMHGKCVDERGYLRSKRGLRLGVKWGEKVAPYKTTLEDWEPFSCTEIVNIERLIVYMRAMLREFGPLHVRLDLRLRLAIFLGDATFEVPPTVRGLVSLLEEESTGFLACDDTLYDVAQPEHRRLLHLRSTGQLDDLPDFSTGRFLAATRYVKPEATSEAN
ncbi:hypothetical protein M3Y99_00606500 [Aphelenchoides fujianensis]|nr:hypothetical protein M3Y99_00606500 [Aphelenchoides fujianensis]